MRSILAIDIGNTNITVGVFRNDQIMVKGKIPTYSYYLYDKKLKALVKKAGISSGDIVRVIISSVVPLALARFIVSVNKALKASIHVLGRDAHAPIKNMYKSHKEVGQDRLVNAYAASRLYGDPSVIIDLGTAITFDVVSREGHYLGGLILPGIEMGLHSLHKRTALLPKVELKAVKEIIGTDTESSMQAGILFGYGAMCDGLILKYRAMLGPDTRAIVTGGNAGLIKQYSDLIDIVDEDLTLKGLRLVASNDH